tara:strand:+ start:969 stop:3530 length:2562 start_codon:yes stop_codon:yes gene_type:complete
MIKWNCLLKFVSFVLLLFVLTFSTKSYADSTSSGSTLPVNLESNCAMMIFDFTESDVEGDVAQEQFVINMINECGYDLFLNNSSNRILYFIFGEVYVEGMYIASKPFSSIISFFLSNYDNKTVDLETGIANFDKDDLKSTFSNHMIFGDVFADMVGVFVLFINSVAALIVGYVFGKKVLKYQSGDFEKEDTKDIMKIFTGITLVSPMPFLMGYSVIQFVLIIAISASVMLANVFFAFVQVMLISAQIDSLAVGTSNNFEEFYGKNLSGIVELTDDLIKSDICLIKQVEDSLDANISEPEILKNSREVGFQTKPDFINCLIDEAAGDEWQKTSGFNQGRITLHDYCVKNYNYYYDMEGEKQTFFASESNCGSYANIPDIKENRDVMSLVNSLRQTLEGITFSFASEYYRNSCLERNVGEIGKGFNCGLFNSLGNYQLYLDPQDGWKVSKAPGANEVSELEKSERLKEINEDVYLNVKNQAKGFYQSIVTSDVMSSVESGVIEEYKERELRPIIKNGFIASSSIFLPKGLLRLFNSDDVSDSIEDVKNRVEQTVLITNYDISEDSEMYGTGLQYYFNKEEIEKQFDDSYEFDVSRVLNIQEAMSVMDSGESCITSRDCDMSLATAMLNPLELYLYIGDNVFRYSSVVALTSNIYLSFVGADGTGSSIVKFIYYISLALTTFGVFSIYLLPMIPFFVFFSAILEWIYKIFKAPIFIQIYAIDYFIPDDGEDLTNDKKDGRIYKLLAEMLIIPLFLVIGVLVTFMVNFIALNILNYGIQIAMLGFMSVSGGGFFALFMFFAFYIVFVFLAAAVILKVSTSMMVVLKTVIQYLDLNGFDDKNQFDGITRQIQNKLMIM